MQRLVVVLLFLLPSSLEERRSRRGLKENRARDDPTALCRNGGNFIDGRCVCSPPHKGPTCEDFECAHGISVGRRYDPASLFFNTPCICEEGWSGDFCTYRMAHKCNDHGEWKENHCECIGYFFGSECQFTSKCEQGERKHGKCICNKGWQGDYCDTIICNQGTPDEKNNSKSCICPKRYKGLHCNECAKLGVEPYPKCTPMKEKGHGGANGTTADGNSKHKHSQVHSRALIIVLASIFLSLVAVFMFCIHCLHKPSKQELEARAREMEERRTMLTLAAFRPRPSTDQPHGTLKEGEKLLPKENDKDKPPIRRLSMPNIFKIRIPSSPS